MTRSDLVEELAARFGQLNQRDAEQAVKTILDAVSAHWYAVTASKFAASAALPSIIARHVSAATPQRRIGSSPLQARTPFQARQGPARSRGQPQDSRAGAHAGTLSNAGLFADRHMGWPKIFPSHKGKHEIPVVAAQGSHFSLCSPSHSTTSKTPPCISSLARRGPRPWC